MGGAAAETATAGPRLRRADFTDLPSFRAHRGPIEFRLLQIWQQVLGLDQVGIDDDFFTLGGDSMAATLMFAELERILGRKLATATLLKAPTVAALAALLREDPRRYAARMLVPIRTTGERPPLVMIHGHNGRVMFAPRIAWLLPATIPVYGIQARGLDGSAPHESVAAMVADYAEELATTFGEREVYLAGYCYGGILAIEVERILRTRGPRVRRIIPIDPPAFPRREAREYTAEELAGLARQHSEGLDKRLDRMAGGNAELKAWYSPGGQGYRSAMQVAESLAKAYSRFVPHPTTAPMTMIWSAQFAQGLRAKKQRWRLAQGPAENRIVARPDRLVTHHMMLTTGLRQVAALIERLVENRPATDSTGLSAAANPAAPSA